MAVFLFHANPYGLNIRHWESFCSYQSSDLKDGKLQCACGENYEIFRWKWEPQAGNLHALLQNDKEVLFHPVYSPGTAAVRGTDALKSNMHHYWEIKILTKLYGTDVMVGVGTSKVLLNVRQFRSMLGFDDQSWGYSYHGFIQHHQLLRRYGSVFGLGSIVGVHLDLYTGTLEYYLNRKPLGEAFRGLKGKDLYPMICSTAAQSAMRLTCSMSLDSTLQMKCLVVIKKYPKLSRLYHSIPGLSRLIKPEYFWLLPPKLKENEDKNDLSLEDEAVLPLSTLVGINNTPSRHRKRLRTNKWNLYEPRADPDHISYRDSMRKMTVSSRNGVNDIVYRGCGIRRPARPKSPPPAPTNEQQDIEDFDDNVQEALQSLSSTIESIREVSDGRASMSTVYEDIDIDDGVIDRELEEDFYDPDPLKCNPSAWCDDYF